MNYKANIDIVLAIEALKISSFRKQGQLRFRVTLLQTDKSYEPQQNKKNVYRLSFRNHPTIIHSAILTTYINNKNNCTSIIIQRHRKHDKTLCRKRTNSYA